MRFSKDACGNPAGLLVAPCVFVGEVVIVLFWLRLGSIGLLVGLVIGLLRILALGRILTLLRVLAWRRVRALMRVLALLRVLAVLIVVVAAIRPAPVVAVTSPLVAATVLAIVADLLEFEAILRVVGAQFVEITVLAAFLAVFLSSALELLPVLRLRLRREDGRCLSLHWLPALDLGLRRVGVFQLGAVVGEQAWFFRLSTLVGQVEEQHHGSKGVGVDAKLLKHPGVRDADGEGPDDRGVLDARDPIANLAEALDVLAQRLTLSLHHCVEVVEGERALVRPLEVGDELLAQLSPGPDGSLGEVHEP